MYLSRLTLNHSRMAGLWAANPYRVHQRLLMACEGDPRLLFRIEAGEHGTLILVQSQQEPSWPAAFDGFAVLATPPEYKPFEPKLIPGRVYRFRLLANPTHKQTGEKNGEKHKTRQGYLKEEEQLAWLRRKLQAAGADLLEATALNQGLQSSKKGPTHPEGEQVHLAVLFDGLLRVQDDAALITALQSGIGPAKGYGFGLLSLALAIRE
jgi:CRISPR system Cascade subunit CasE